MRKIAHSFKYDRKCEEIYNVTDEIGFLPYAFSARFCNKVDKKKNNFKNITRMRRSMGAYEHRE